MSDTPTTPTIGVNSPKTPKPTCHLYTLNPVDRVLNELKHMGKQTGELQVAETLPFDQMHYMGTDSIDQAVKELGLQKGASVMDVGSGFGGPARYLTWKYDLQVAGLELQDDLVVLANDLSDRMQSDLKGRCTFHCGSITEELPELLRGNNNFDAVTGWLVFLHVPERDLCWKQCFSLLKPGGQLFSEDFYLRKDLTPEEAMEAADVVGCSGCVPSKDDYCKELQDAGFNDIVVRDLSEEWTQWVSERSRLYMEQKQRHIAVQGEQVFEQMATFYRVISKLFASGALGGFSVKGTRPPK